MKESSYNRAEDARRIGSAQLSEKENGAVRVRVAQINVTRLDGEANRQQMYDCIENEALQGAFDLMVFPELANIGYVSKWDKGLIAEYIQHTEEVPGPTTEILSESARRHRIHIVVGLGRRHPRIPATIYNSAVMIGPDGSILQIYDKVHLAGDERHFFVPGVSFEPVQTELGCLGMLLCTDLTMFPEASRILALRGTEIILAPFNIPHRKGSVLPMVLEGATSTRASENKLFVVTCNRVGEEGGLVFFGGSTVADPSGEVIASAKDSECVLRAEIRLKRITEERSFIPVFRDRLPHLYSDIARPI